MRGVASLTWALAAGACGRIGFEPPPAGGLEIGPMATSCEYDTPAGPVFHVAPGGSDVTGTGATTAPWASPGYAYLQVAPGATILVEPGTYAGQLLLDRAVDPPIVLRAAIPYTARLTHDAATVVCAACSGVVVEGFEITQTPTGSGQLVSAYGGASAFVVRNNVVHDAASNALIRINLSTGVVVARNLVYNAATQSIHVADATATVVEDNLVFSDFAASGRAGEIQTSSMIWLEDFSGVGNVDHRVRRNVVLHSEARNVSQMSAWGISNAVVENNLIVGDNPEPSAAAFLSSGNTNLTVRHNTIVGDLPGDAFFKLDQVAGVTQGVVIEANAWSDPTGTMTDFADGIGDDVTGLVMRGNLFWNGGQPIPEDTDVATPSVDATRVIGDPLHPDAAIVRPVWDPVEARFADGSTTICEAFVRVVAARGAIGESGAAHLASTTAAPGHDILGRPRGPTSSIGAFEPQ